METEIKAAPNYEAMYLALNEAYVKLEKENADLHAIEDAYCVYQDKLHDEIDNLRKIIALLTKEWL